MVGAGLVVIGVGIGIGRIGGSAMDAIARQQTKFKLQCLSQLHLLKELVSRLYSLYHKPNVF